MYNQLVALVTKYQDAVKKLEVLNQSATDEIMTIIAQRRTEESRYKVLQNQRAERTGTIFAYKNAIRDISQLTLEHDGV